MFFHGASGCALVGWVATLVVGVLIVARVQCRMLRSVHCPRMCMRWLGDSPPAAVSPLVKPMTTSLTSGEGDVRVPSLSIKRVYNSI